MAKIARSKTATEGFVYGVVTRSENRIEERIERLEEKMDKRFDKVIKHLVNIAGKFKKFDEEQTVVSRRTIDHGDRIEKLEEAVFKTP